MLTLRLFISLLLLASSTVASATVTASASNCARTITSSATPTVTLPTDAPAGAFIVFGAMERTDTTSTISSVADPANGNYTVREGPSNWLGGATGRSWLYTFSNSAALTGTDKVITVTFSGVVSAQVVACWISSDQGALTYDAIATLTQINPTSTTWTSNNVTTGTGSGVTVGFISTSTAQTANPTMSGSEVLMTTAADSGRRSFLTTEIFASQGSYGFGTTLNDSSIGNYHVISLLEPAGSTCRGGLMMMGVGGC